MGLLLTKLNGFLNNVVEGKRLSFLFDLYVQNSHKSTHISST